jgi:carboxypeptidase C (cathepsin A)
MGDPFQDWWNRMRWFVVVPVMVLLAAPAGALHAQPPTPPAANDADQKPAGPEPKAEQSVTTHRLGIAGTPIDYTATAGTLIVRGDDEKPIASMG